MKNEPIHIYIGEDVSTLTEARTAIQGLLSEEEHPSSIIVHIPSGTYTPDEFRFTAHDCAVDCTIHYQAESGAVIHGGRRYPSEFWQQPDDAMRGRLPEASQPHVRMLSLSAHGLHSADWGPLTAIGAYETSVKYDTASHGGGCEVFCDDRRMTLARYPNEGQFAHLQAIIDVGDCYEFPSQNYFYEWDNRRNHRGGSYVIDPIANERVKKWQDPSSAWMFGYFFHDWADSSTPIASVDTAHRIVNPEYVSRYGARADAPYYFYNVPEELDEPGEWYLDRNNGNLYFYPYEGSTFLDFSYSDQPLISCLDTVNLKFSGFTLLGTMGDAIQVHGSHMVFDQLTIYNVAGNGITATGSDILVTNCDISHTGRGGIILQGGDRSSLTPGANRASNNYIHDFSEIYLTYQPGIKLEGVGNQCDHNEICGSPHMAIGYSGNEHLIEYNDIHHVVLQSSDAGAIYSGYDWAAHGTVIRYNLLRHIGQEPFTPDGIYWDDGLSGQTAYGNLLIDVRKFSFLAGGGRENRIEGNVIIDSGMWPIHYDDRNRDGFLHDGWAKAAVNHPDAPHWQHLREVPYNSAIWSAKYPLLAAIKTDFSVSPEDPDFPINPSYSFVRYNVIIDARCNEIDYRGGITNSVFRYSTVDGNIAYASREEACWDEKTLSFTQESPVYNDIPQFKNIPIQYIGRHQ